MGPFCHRNAGFGAVIHSFMLFMALRLGLVLESPDNEVAEQPHVTTDGGA
ncbi:hypothetical protein ARZXY2_1000 [Arthrobacter sp. ZXY-2]|nr:hypothetical protein ARZXY2_1000 [Arthrobacter sp. ZXY-2]